METFLSFIADYTLALNVLALGVYTFAVKRLTAFNLVVSGGILLGVIHAFIADGLGSLFGVEEYAQAVTLAWYFSFAFTDLALVIGAKHFIARYALLKDKASSLLIYCYMLLAVMQIARFADREILSTDSLGALYKSGVVSMNIFMTLIVCMFAVKAALVYCNLKYKSTIRK